MKNISRFLLAILMLAPISVSAVTADELQAQTDALLQRVQVLQAQLAAQQSAQGSSQAQDSTQMSAVSYTSPGVAQAVAQAAASSGATGGFCPGIGRTLQRNSTGDDVTRLQKFLAQDPLIYPEGTMSGYFGALTEAAVQKWQAKFHIVTTGSPATTGYGVVGPRTAAAIAIVCSGGSYNGVSGAVSSPPVGGFIQVSPISGNAPLTVAVQATINTTKSCSAAIYTLNFGDGTNPAQIPSSAGVCNQQTAQFSHVYQYGGSYSITLAAGSHQTSATVTVYGASAPAVPVTTTVPNTPSSLQSAIQITDGGYSPKILTVVPGTTITWTNTGTMQHTVSADNASFGSGTLQPGQTYSQTFNAVGSYPYYCAFHGNKGGVGQSGIITVASTAAPSTPAGSTAAGPLTVSPASGGNPLAIQLQFDMNGCPSYTVNWGDGTPAVANTASCGTTSGVQRTTLSHTYSQSGSYTIAVVRGSQSDTAGVVISN